MRFVSRTRYGPEDTRNTGSPCFIYSICCATSSAPDSTCNVRFSCVKSVFRLPTVAGFASQMLRPDGKLFFVVNSVPKWVLRAGIVKNNGKPVPGLLEVVAAKAADNLPDNWKKLVATVCFLDTRAHSIDQDTFPYERRAN